MKKICIIGHFAEGKNLLNGQTVKTKIIADELMKLNGKQKVITIDTHGSRTLLKAPFMCIKALKEAENIIILPAENGLRVFAPLLVLFNCVYGKKLHYIVIGGWLPTFLQNKKYLFRALKHFTGIYVETNTMKKVLNNGGMDNVYVIPNCKNIKILEKKELPLLYEEPYKLCTFSRVMKEKGIEDAVKSVVEINQQYGRVVYSLDIYGQIEPTQAEWFSELQKQFPEYVKYLGMVPYNQSTDVLKNYFALLFPTYYEGEGFAGTLIDAMAAGLPTIASNWKYNSEIIKNGKTGMIIEKDLKESLCDLMTNVDAWCTMKLACIDDAFMYLPQNALKPLIDKLR